MQTKNEYQVIIKSLEELKNDIAESTKVIKEFNIKMLEHEQRLNDHDTKLNIHDEKIETIEKKFKLNGNDILSYLGYILAVLGIGINVFR